MEVDIARGERIRAFREQTGRTQEETAALVGVSSRVYLGWETHGKPIRRRNLVQLAAVLRRDVRDVDPDAPPVAPVDMPAAMADGALPEIRDQLETLNDRLNGLEGWIKRLEAAGRERGRTLGEVAAAVADLATLLEAGELAQPVADAPAGPAAGAKSTRGKAPRGTRRSS